MVASHTRQVFRELGAKPATGGKCEGFVFFFPFGRTNLEHYISGREISSWAAGEKQAPKGSGGTDNCISVRTRGTVSAWGKSAITQGERIEKLIQIGGSLNQTQRAGSSLFFARSGNGVSIIFFKPLNMILFFSEICCQHPPSFQTAGHCWAQELCTTDCADYKDYTGSWMIIPWISGSKMFINSPNSAALEAVK